MSELKRRPSWNERPRPSLARAAAEIDLSGTNLAQGYDYQSMIRATPDGANAFDPRFNMDDLFSPGTSGHFLVKWLF